jgi:hypothetical protein
MKGEYVGHPSRSSVWCDPVRRFTRQPIRFSASKTRRAFAAAKRLIPTR